MSWPRAASARNAGSKLRRNPKLLTEKRSRISRARSAVSGDCTCKHRHTTHRSTEPQKPRFGSFLREQPLEKELLCFCVSVGRDCRSHYDASAAGVELLGASGCG